MNRLLLALLFLASCTRHRAGAANDAGSAAVVPEPAPHPTPPPPAEAPIPLAADGGLGALLEGTASAARLPEAATEGDAGFDKGLRERLTTVDAPLPDGIGRGDVTIGDIVSKPPIANAERAIAGLRPRFRACYQRGLRGEPSMSGTMTITANITPQGDVEAPNVTANVGISSAVTSCVAAVFRHAGFPPSSATSTLAVTLTFAAKK